MTENEFVGKWQLRFRNNDLFEIDEGDLREFTQDIAATFGQDDPRAVFEHIFENQFGKHPYFNTQHEVNAFVLQLLTAKQVQAAPEAPEFSLFDDAANTVVLSHKNYSYLDLRYDLPGGAVGLPVPADGIIKPGNIAGQVVGYVRAAGGRLQSEKTYSPVFTSVTATPQVKPTAPKLLNFDDVANTVNVYHPNHSSVDLRYNFNGQTGLLVSADGLISVGNVAGQVEAYVVADAAQNRVQGLPAYSQPFTTGSVVTPPVSSAPMVTGFGPTSAAIGAAVTITGTNFTGATAVLFNGTAAAFTVLNATTINATVPAGATSGPVSVATPAGTGTSAATFTVTVATTPVALAVAFTIGSSSLTAGQNLPFSAQASGGTAPYTHQVQATHTGTGVVTAIGSATTATYAGTWQSVPAGTYELTDTVTDAAGTVKISAVRTLTVANTGGSQDVARVIISVGQSNSMGKANGADLTAAPLSIYNLWQPFPLLQQWNPKLGVPAFQPLEHGVNDLTASDSTDCGGVAPGGGGAYGADLFGWDLGFASRLAQVRPSTTFYRVKKSADGQSLASILTGGGWKASLYERLAGAKASLQAQGKTYHCDLLTVHFGETDALNNTAYGPLLNQLLNELLAAGYIQADTITVLVGLKDTANVPAANMRAQMAAWVAAAPATRRVTNPAIYQGIPGDLLHLNGVTQMQIGHSDIVNAWLGTTDGFRIPTTLPPTEPPAGSFLTGTYQENEASRLKAIGPWTSTGGGNGLSDAGGNAAFLPAGQAGYIEFTIFPTEGGGFALEHAVYAGLRILYTVLLDGVPYEVKDFSGVNEAWATRCQKNGLSARAYVIRIDSDGTGFGWFDQLRVF